MKNIPNEKIDDEKTVSMEEYAKLNSEKTVSMEEYENPNYRAFDVISDHINRFNTGKLKITMSSLDKPDMDQIANIDNNEPGYDRINVYDSMNRTANITVINDGPDEIYFIVNRNGIDHQKSMWSQNEISLYPGEVWKIYHVHELRIRSEYQGNEYRITEDDIIIGSAIRSVS